MKRCEKCGMPSPDGANFCQSCENSMINFSEDTVMKFSSASNEKEETSKLVQISKVIVYVWTFFITHTLVRAAFIAAYMLRSISAVASEFDLERLELDAEKFASVSHPAQSITANIIFSAVVIAAALIRKRSVKQRFRLRRFDQKLVPAFILFGFSSNVILSFIMSLIPWPQEVIDGRSYAYSFVSFSSVILIILSTAVVTGFTEELLFRSVIITRLRPAFGSVAASAVSCSVFAVCHAEPVAITYSFIFSIFLTLFFIKYDSLWPSVISHIVFNLTGIALEYLPNDFLVAAAVLTGSAALFILSMFLIFRKNTKPYIKTNTEGRMKL